MTRSPCSRGAVNASLQVMGPEPQTANTDNASNQSSTIIMLERISYLEGEGSIGSQVSKQTEEEKLVRLLLTLPPEAFHQVAELTSVHSVLLTLETIYSPQTEATKKTIMEKLYTIKLTSCTMSI